MSLDGGPVNRLYIEFTWAYGVERIAVASISAARAYRTQLRDHFGPALFATMTDFRLITALETAEPLT